MDESILLTAILILACVVIAPVLAIIALVKIARLGRTSSGLQAEVTVLRRKVNELRKARVPATQEPVEEPKAADAPPEEQEPRRAETPSGEPEFFRYEPPRADRERGDAKPALPKPQQEEPSAEPAAPLPAEALDDSSSETPPRAHRVGVEERLGVRIPVWIGAIALALAGVFLVKYTFDKGLLTPTTRLILGSVLGAVLLVGGELLRGGYWRIAQALSAAGIAVLYACLLAAVNLYHLVDPAVGFGLMILVTAAAVALSIRQGPVVAVIGLVGGFVMPAFIHTGEPRPAGLFGYILLLEIGLVAVAGKRRWWWIGGVTLLAGMGWAAVWVQGMFAGHFPREHGLWVGLFLIASIVAFVLSDRLAKGKAALEPGWKAQILTWGAVTAGLILLAFLTKASGFSTLQWCFLGILGAGCLLLARLDPSKESLAGLAAITGLVLLAVWHWEGVEEEQLRYGLTALCLGLLYGLGGYFLLWGARRPAFWATLASAAVVAYFLVVYWEVTTLPSFLSWGSISLALASLCIAGAFPVARRRESLPQGLVCLAALAVAATSLISLAVPLELERQWISVAWALEVLALAWLEKRLGTPQLRLLAAALAIAVGVRLLLNPAVLEYPLGTAILWNWLLYGYGIPILAFAGAVKIYRELGEDLLAVVLEIAAMALGFALLTLQVRQYFHPANLGTDSFYLAEWATYSIAWLLYGITLLEVWRGVPRPTLLYGGAALGILALAQGLMTQGLAANPLWSSHPVGETPVFNGLLYTYGLPALLGLVLTRRLATCSGRWLARASGICSLLLLFLLVTLEVRQGFQGSFLNGPGPTSAEWYAYSAAWILLGTVLLILGIVTRGTVVRYASLAVMLISVGKVFLFDTRELRDLYRVVSFLGLGVSLLLLAFLYQRFVFRRQEE